ncbi:UDP-glucose 4-epimerase GalE [Candidatus Blastococcus massiliensis]|uniref:UDP-glucose 4-epimerase GalE n=1 Tax=Candidatus Blastococcus massiliensis TaxID=1470358 RepID=UPI0009E091BA|nr:UDP-glucose 4-epimerase GalE [Candidatus Blastococcus massiliensis]
MTWLVTGGAGYIGAHIVQAMRSEGKTVVVLDDLSTGHATRIDGVPLVHGSVLDYQLVEHTLRRHAVTGIVHLAAKKQVDESVRLPLYYYRENVEGLRRLLEAAIATDVEAIVFSSSAAVYGAPTESWVTEDTQCSPINPYGHTKLTGEWMVEAAAAAAGLRYANLRYFNVAGCSSPTLADLGGANIVPMVLRRLDAQQAPMIFGDSYPTQDGTCVRDYVHVADIASAHAAAANALAGGDIKALTANIGTGVGYSVREIVETLRVITGHESDAWAEPIVAPARAGDPPRVVAATDRIRDALGWRARHDVGQMLTSAWEGWVANRGR